MVVCDHGAFRVDQKAGSERSGGLILGDSVELKEVTPRGVSELLSLIHLRGDVNGGRGDALHQIRKVGGNERTCESRECREQ